MKNNLINFKKSTITKTVVVAFILSVYNLLCNINTALAQDGNAGIAEATNKVKSYFDTGCDLMYAIGAVVGIIGAIKVLCAMN